MPICRQCGHKWSWKETFVKLYTFKNKLTCSYCKSNQYISKKSKDQLSLYTIIVPLVYIPLVSIGVSIGYILTCGITTYILMSICMPFLIKLSNEDEPMW
ncbi:TIGR04104 family putative zinc finger protein [Rummeliibacillus pycnus]|uniref:TIGR04104 family putative zinc finger protein n=1 Tax=Rummeliibacillus pycnus TaxID=101070 RepID=UPI000C9A25A4